MKRLCGILCACVMLLTMWPLSFAVSAQDTAVITIETVKKAPISAGSTFQIKLSTNRIAHLAALELHLKYDSSCIEAVGGTASGWLSEMELNTVHCESSLPSENGIPMREVRLTGMTLQEKDSMSGEVFATITFKAIKAVTDDVALKAFSDSNMLITGKFQTLPLTIIDGGVDIVKPVTAAITSESSTASYAAKDAVASASVTAIGDGLTYTWYLKNPGAAKYSKSSVTTNTYKVKMTAANSGRLVYCVVKDEYGNEVRSKTFVLRMKATITSVPATAAYAKLGEKVSVKIAAAGDGLTYTWYIKNAGGTKYSKSSVTSATYATTMSSAVKGRLVYCVVKDKYGKTAQTKTFVLREAVSITSQPTNAYGKSGAKVSVKVGASGDGLTYMWYIKNAGQTKYTKSSVTGSTYTTVMNSTSKDRLLVCKVKDQYGNLVQAKTVQLKMK